MKLLSTSVELNFHPYFLYWNKQSVIIKSNCYVE